MLVWIDPGYLGASKQALKILKLYPETYRYPYICNNKILKNYNDLRHLDLLKINFFKKKRKKEVLHAFFWLNSFNA